VKIWYLRSILFLIILFITQAGCQNVDELIKPQQDVSAQSEKMDNSIHLKITDYLLSKRAFGSIAIVKNKQLIFNEGVGFSDVKNRIVNQAETTFPIASITKVIVATSIIQLQERGKLSIQDPVSKYIPEIPNSREMKLIHLLNHTSGIKTPLWNQGDREPGDITKRIGKSPVAFPAGEQWDYNDINYLILGVIVEKVAGTSLHEYIQKHIFDRAFMNHSGFITRKLPDAFSSIGYVRIADQMIKSKHLDIPMLFGCGDIYATALDVTKFDRALMSGKLVTKDSVKKMLTPGSKSKYGLGLYISNNHVFSRGVLSGWESLHAYYQDKTSLAILLNVHDKKINIHEIAEDLYKIINGKK
jgi:CubicO group peptidase (beta-lactamase class C family)